MRIDKVTRLCQFGWRIITVRLKDTVMDIPLGTYNNQ